MAALLDVGTAYLKAKYGNNSDNTFNKVDFEGDLNFINGLIGHLIKKPDKFNCEIKLKDEWIDRAAENILKQNFGQNSISGKYIVKPEKNILLSKLSSIIDILSGHQSKSKDEDDDDDDDIFEPVTKICFNCEKMIANLDANHGLKRTVKLSDLEQYANFIDKIRIFDSSNINNSTTGAHQSKLENECEIDNPNVITLDVKNKATWTYVQHHEQEKISKLLSEHCCTIKVQEEAINGNLKLFIASKKNDRKVANSVADKISNLYQKYVTRDDDIVEDNVIVKDPNDLKSVLDLVKMYKILSDLKLTGYKLDVERIKSLIATKKVSNNSSNVVLREHNFESGLKMFISKGNLVHQTTNAIVNPANSLLLHGGGAARAIASAAGKILNDECEEYIRKKKSLPETYAWHSSAGNLMPNIQFVIHAVGPQNNKDNLTKEDRTILSDKLIKTFYNCLKYANDDLHINSIAIPAISSGIYRVPMDIVTRSMFSAMENFEKEYLKNKKRSLNEVHFVNFDDKTVDAISEAFDKYFDKKTNKDGSSVDNKKIARHAEDDVQELPCEEVPNQVPNQVFKSDYRNRSKNKDSIKPQEKDSKLDEDQHHKADLPNSKINRSENVDKNEIKTTHRHKPDGNDIVEVEVKNDVEKVKSEKEEEKEQCTICLDDLTDPVKLICGHSFCKDCINENSKRGQQKCPNCGKVYGKIIGNQPHGTMNHRIDYQPLPGYSGCKTIAIDYYFGDGIQRNNHPNPGKPYRGTRRKAYLPDNKEGNEVLALFKKAFDSKLLFTIGRSVTTGRDDVVVWNDIHQKTSYTGEYGYPDPTYFDRVKRELADKGIE